MRFNCTSGALFLAVAGGAFGCAAYPTIKPAPLDCNADSAYAINPVDETTAFGYGDSTTGATMSVGMSMLTDGDRCGTTSALLIQAHQYNDWGAAVSFYGFILTGTTHRDESASDGLSFWARAPGSTGKAFTVVLDDYNTYDPTVGTDPANPVGSDPNKTDSNCVAYSRPDGGSTVAPIYDPGTGMILSTGMMNVTPPNACGNSYSAYPVVTGYWQFYTIPFSRFVQTATANRVPNPSLPEAGAVPGTGLLTNYLMLLTLRIPKGTDMDLWIDKLGFYRAKGAAGADGGVVDAP